MTEFKWLWGYIKKYRGMFITAMVFVAVISLLNMVNPYIQGIIVDKAIKGGQTEILLTLVLIIVGATVIKSILRYVYLYFFEYVSQGVAYDVRERIFKKLGQLDFEFFDKTKTGDIMARMTGDMEVVRYFTAYAVFSIFLNLITFITVIVILFSTNAVITLALLAITPIIAILAYRMARTVKPVFSAIREQFSRLNSVVQENISGNRVVKAFAREDYEIYKFARENMGYKDRNIDASKIWEKYLPVLDSLAGVLSIIVILVGGILVMREEITLGQLVTFNGYIWALNQPLRMAGWLINDVQRFIASAEKIMLLLDKAPKIMSSSRLDSWKRPTGRVEFRDVSFSYGGEPVLEDISFSAYPGQTIAVMGETGSGKSTLVSLISRFYDCTKGKVLIDGIDIKDYDLRTLRESIAVAMQDIFLFSDTIEGNIAYGMPEASLERVKWAAKMAEAAEFIEPLSEGYDTIIGERGVGLSGGQKQRIALARAIIKDSSIIIFDDTTSSVDIETEHAIHQSLKEFYRDKTAFVIAHRISSVKNADLILFLHEGKIVERGTHQELMDLKGYYYEVFINQYGDYVSEADYINDADRKNSIDYVKVKEGENGQE